MTPVDNYEAVAAELRAQGIRIGGADELPPITPEEEARFIYFARLVCKAYNLKMPGSFHKLPRPKTP